MKPAEYWAKRSERMLLAAERQGSELVRSLIGFYSDTARQLQTEVDAFFGRYAAQNGMTMEEAQKRLTSEERQSFQQTLEFYLQEVKRLGLGREHEQYLRTLAGRVYISRQQELITQARQQVETLFRKGEDSFSETLQAVYPDSYYRTLYDIQQGIGLGVDFARIDTKAIETLMRKPWLGDNYSSRLWQNKARLLGQLEQVIPQAFATGQNSRILGQQLAARLGVSQSAGERLARTEVNHAANQAARAAYREYGVEEYEYLATLDNRTSEACAALDGKVFRLADAAAGINYPPMHPNCRSTTVPYFPPDALDEPAQRAARGRDGKYYTVPADMTYAQWYQTQVDRYGQKALDLDRRKWRNQSADLKQYSRYKEILGKDAPAGFGAFQDAKYGDGPMWNYLQLDHRRKKRLVDHPDLALPSAAQASAADAKFTGYLFNSKNPQGYAKGIAFEHRLGYTVDKWKALQREIVTRAPLYPAKHILTDEYGSKYEQKIVLYGLKGTPANVVVGWQVKDGRTWMTSAYLKEVKGNGSD